MKQADSTSRFGGVYLFTIAPAYLAAGKAYIGTFLWRVLREAWLAQNGISNIGRGEASRDASARSSIIRRLDVTRGGHFSSRRNI